MEYRELTEAEKRARRRRSIVLAFVLAGLAVMFFFSTIVRLGGNVGDRTM
jgi:hypothetical protein